VNHAVRDEIDAVRTRVGWWADTDAALLRVAGSDAPSWLQTQVTSDVLALEPNHGQPSALLDRKGRMHACFSIHRTDDEFWLIAPAALREPLLQRLANHIFIEDVLLADGTDDVEFLVIQGPQCRLLLAKLVSGHLLDAAAQMPQQPHAGAAMRVAGLQAFVFQHSSTGEDGFRILVQRGDGPPVLAAIAAQAGPLEGRAIGPEAQTTLRIEAGIPRYGADMDHSTLVSETPLVHEAVSYTKGCYLGQEVVARLKAYGSVRKMLLGLRFPDSTPLPPRNTLMLEGPNSIGNIKSSAYSPTLDASIALAYLDRECRAPGQQLVFRLRDYPAPVRAVVVALPFYTPPSRRERAQALYREALAHFERDLHDRDDAAITLLEQAVLLDPLCEDAYEALGVILSRHHRMDDAIRAIDVLARLNPRSIMAHSNLSVFYMKKGNLERAEEEKALAKQLETQQTVNLKQAEAEAAAERRRIEADARARIAMFGEVLELDPDDPLATFGLGSAHMQLQQFAHAIPHLRRSTQLQKDYSAAYLSLGKCHEFVGDLEQAAAVYTQGIAVASRKGDLMPLREMERRLKALAPADTLQDA
jgi:folate-binding protein YgfZ